MFGKGKRARVPKAAEAARLEEEGKEAAAREAARLEAREAAAREAARLEEVSLEKEAKSTASNNETEDATSIGGIGTCIVCFTHEKTHLAYPCGHQCVCADCSKALKQCPYCRIDVAAWVRVNVA